LIGIVTFGVTAWIFVRATRIAVVVSPDGLLVRNLFRTHRLPWPHVADVRPRLVGSRHLMLTIGVVDARLTRVDALATLTVVRDSGVRLLPLLAVLDVHAVSDDVTVDHCLPDGTILPGSPAAPT
jgi:hypothetical protein